MLLDSCMLLSKQYIYLDKKNDSGLDKARRKKYTYSEDI